MDKFLPLTPQQEELLNESIATINTYLRQTQPTGIADLNESFLWNPRRQRVVRGLRIWHEVCVSFINRKHKQHPTKKGSSYSLTDVEMELGYSASEFLECYSGQFRNTIARNRIYAVRTHQTEKIRHDRRRYVREDTEQLIRFYLIRSDFALKARIVNDELEFLANVDQPAGHPELLKLIGNKLNDGGNWFVLKLMTSGADKPENTKPKPPIPDPLGPNTLRYFAFYPRHGKKKEEEKIGFALVEVPDGQWVNAKMTYYYSDRRLVFTLPQDSTISPHQGLSLYLTMQRSKHEPDADGKLDRDATTNREKRLAPYVHIVLNYSDGPTLYLVGTYNTIHWRDEIATAGLMVWMRFDGPYADLEKTTDHFLNQANIPPVVSYSLINKRIDTANGKFDRQESLPDALSFLNSIGSLADTYQGYYVHPVSQSVVLFECIIDPLGKVNCFYQASHKGAVLLGYVRVFNNAVQISLFDTNPPVENQEIRLQYHLKKKPFVDDSGQEFLVGVCAGYDFLFTNPTAGRVVLRRCTANEKPEIKDYQQSVFQRRPYAAQVLSLLRGANTQTKYMTDSVMYYQTFGFVFDQGNGIAIGGEYDCFLGTRPDDGDPDHTRDASMQIARYRLIIDNDGFVSLYSHAEQIGLGQCIIHPNGFLIIQLTPVNDQVEQGFFGLMLLSLKKQSGRITKSTEVKHLFGMLTKIENRRVGSMAVVVRASDKVWIEDNSDNQAMGESVNKELPSVFYRSHSITGSDIPHDLFDQYDADFSGLLSFMEGQTYRLMRIPRTANRPFRPRKIDYRRVGFYAACYLVKQSKFTEARRHLKESYHLGFAAEKFAGVAVRDWHLRDTQDYFFTTHYTPIEYRNELSADIASLRQDQTLLWDAFTPDCLAHEQIREWTEKLWPYLKNQTTSPVDSKTQKPEAPQ